MLRRVLHISLLSMFGLAGLSQTTSFERTRLQTLDKGKQEMINVDFQLEKDKAVIVSKKEATVLWEIPFAEIANVSYDGARNRRSELVPLVGVGALFSKSTSHWLIFEHGTDGKATDTVLQFHKDDFEEVIALLEARTGKSVTILTKSRINPTEGSENVDKVVPHSLEQVRLALRPAMEGYGCQITEG